jgi:hypothetical protein
MRAVRAAAQMSAWEGNGCTKMPTGASATLDTHAKAL